MCLVARQLEAAGIATLCLTSARDITGAGRPPRAAFLDFPLGHTSGKPGQPELNRAIMSDALTALETITEPGTIVDLPYRWAATDEWKDGVFVPEETPDGEIRWADDRAERYDSPQYQTPADGRQADERHADQECLVCAGIDY